MFEANNKQLLANVLSLLMVLLTASGIFVSTLPLESKRPADAERAKISYAGRQDVEARLWQDPFTVMRRVKGETQQARCAEAKDDREHHPNTLSELIARRSRYQAVTVLPVMVPGGPYFEDGESRRRTRYAVVTALLNSGWEPSDEDKLGYVWTFESCIDNPWLRWAPELLPWEWFSRKPGDGRSGSMASALLVLWVDENVAAPQPLRAIHEIIKGLMRGGMPCPAPQEKKQGLAEARRGFDRDRRRAQALTELAETDRRLCPPRDSKPMTNTGCAPQAHPDLPGGFPDRKLADYRPWCATRVIGPATSDGLQGLARDLASPPEPLPEHGWLRFYSSGATAATDEAFLDTIIEGQRRYRDRAATGPTRTSSAAELAERLDQRLLRLTTTDDKLASALVDELKSRLIDPHPFWRLTHGEGAKQALCGATVVIVAERGVSYSDLFWGHLNRRLSSECASGPPLILLKSYLRGLDGVLPEGTGAPIQPAQSPAAQAGKEALLAQAPRERADGRSQYDYLRRLAADLAELDARERGDQRAGVRAIGILGYDPYDRMLVLEALRGRFPRAVFFTADLDARMMGGDVTKWTRNLVVASAYGLTLNPGIQRSAPPFRDTYQSGTYLSTLVALDPRMQALGNGHFREWFGSPRLFEIGRTRAVALSAGASTSCSASELDPSDCRNVHALDQWTSFPRPPASTLFALSVALLAMLVLWSLICEGSPRERLSRLGKRWTLVAACGLAAILLAALSHAIWRDVSTHEGEPFAWLEGVSIWPTVLFHLAALLLIVALLWWFLHRLAEEIDGLGEHFVLQGAPECASETPARPAGLVERLRSLWWLDPPNDAGRLWRQFSERMRQREQAKRIALTTLLAFAFSVALISTDWPNSTHRGAFSAWVNHLGLLLILLILMASVCAVVDASAMTTRFIDRLELHIDPGMAAVREPRRDHFWQQAPMDEAVMTLATWFRLVVRVGSAVKGLVYLPVIALLLLIPARARVFDAWTFPLTYALLLILSALLAVLCALRLRRVAARLRMRISTLLDERIARCELAADLAGPSPAAALELPQSIAWRHLPPAAGARRIKAIRDEILAERGGPFRPLAEDPVVRAILLLLGGTGAITTAQFLFLSGS